MKQFQVIYDENKKLDQKFDELYDNYKQETIEKNILELLVEIGELANETRCFKYWSTKGPSPKKIVIDEYADCLLMIFNFLSMKKIELTEQFPEIKENNPVVQFKHLYYLVSNLNVDLNNELLKEIFANLINLGKLLDFTLSDIIDGSLAKIKRNFSRFETGF